MEFSELKLEKSDFESVFELIGPSIDALLSKKRKEEVINIPFLLDEIKKIEVEIKKEVAFSTNYIEDQEE